MQFMYMHYCGEPFPGMCITLLCISYPKISIL